MINRSSHSLIQQKLTDVIEAKISDHQPVMHDGVLFWNVMMQGKLRKTNTLSLDYNNGLGIVEDEKKYLQRLEKISCVIAEIIHRRPDISFIGLCEGPIAPEHVRYFFQLLKRFSCMEKFLARESFEKPAITEGDDWGLLMLADNRYKIASTDFLKADKPKNLINRFQLWSLEHNGNKKYFALGHFPFCGNQHASERSQLSAAGILYCDIIKKLLDKYSNAQLIFSADFNFNPFLIKTWQERFGDSIPSHNSRIFASAEGSATVDGILLSKGEKQKFYSTQVTQGLFAKLKREHSLALACIKSGCEARRRRFIRC